MFILRLGVLAGICSLGALLSPHHLVFDLISHFRIQYILLILAVLSVALYRQRYLISLVLALCMSVHVLAVYQSQSSRENTLTGELASLSLMSSNLLASNDDHVSQLAHIESMAPDVIVFQEYTAAWDAALSVSLDEYPFRLAVPLDSPFGIAIYSKLPLQDEEVVDLLHEGRPSLQATVAGPAGALTVFGSHPPPPLSIELYKERNRHLQAISDRLVTHTEPVVVVGDLNISPWSAHFSRFLAAGKLFDGRRGHGVLPTWPAGFVPLLIPIDHMLVNEAVNVVSMQTGDQPGSDHRSLWAELEFRQ